MWSLIWHVRVLADSGRQKQRRPTETDAKLEEAAQAILRARDAGPSFCHVLPICWMFMMMGHDGHGFCQWEIVPNLFRHFVQDFFWVCRDMQLAQKFKHLFLAPRETMQGPSGWRCGLRLRTSMQHFFMFTCCFTYSTRFVMTGWKHRLPWAHVGSKVMVPQEALDFFLAAAQNFNSCMSECWFLISDLFARNMGVGQSLRASSIPHESEKNRLAARWQKPSVCLQMSRDDSKDWWPAFIGCSGGCRMPQRILGVWP